MEIDEVFEDLRSEGWTDQELDELALDDSFPEIEIAAEYGEA